MGEDAYLGGSRPGMVGSLREALGIQAEEGLGLSDFDTGELEIDYDSINNPQTPKDLTESSLYGLKKALSAASTDGATEAKLSFLADYGVQHVEQAQSADDVIRFILALDPLPTASPHSLVSRLFAAAHRAAAYAARASSR